MYQSKITRFHQTLGPCWTPRVHASYVGWTPEDHWFFSGPIQRFLPIGSMGLVYLPTFFVDFYGKCRWICQSHGSYASGLQKIVRVDAVFFVGLLLTQVVFFMDLVGNRPHQCPSSPRHFIVAPHCLKDVVLWGYGVKRWLLLMAFGRWNHQPDIDCLEDHPCQ